MSLHVRPGFFSAKHALNMQLELTENYDFVETPEGFKDIQLYPHQATVVKGIMDVEDRRVVTVKTIEFGELTSGEVIIETSALVLSEPFGSGKTMEILALILLRPIPKAFPTHVNSVTMNNPSTKFVPYRQRNHKPELVWRHEITRRFTGLDALLRPNLIVVGSSVLVQWENAIKEFTSLRSFTIGDVYALQKFLQMYNDNKIKVFDIILLKNGTVTGNFRLPGEDPADFKEHRSLITVMSKITAGRCWSRVIYDDFDTIKIPPGSGTINALFTIYVSATTKIDPNHGKNINTTYASLFDALRERSTPLNLVTSDRALFTNFNVRNAQDYVEASTRITKINGFRYVYANPDDNYIRLIGAMGEADANNIMEMLNGDAIGTAAEALGIKTGSVADIFQRMLDKKYERYMHDQYVLETLDKIRNQVIPSLNDHPEGKKHSNTELEAIRAAISKKTIPQMKFYSRALDQLLDDMTTEYTHAKEQDGLAIHRVIANIKEGECQVCRLPLTDFDTFIVRCCGLIVCDVCGIKGNQIQRRYDYKIKGETICGSCANCKATIYPQKDLIFVDKNFDMEAILRAKGDEKPAEPIVEAPLETEDAKEAKGAEEAEEAELPKEPEIKNPKLKALRAIVRGENPEAKEEVAIHVKHLLMGKVDVFPDALTVRKVVVFANFNETLNLVEEFLVEQKITFLRLGGTFQEKADTVKLFKTYGQVLLINSQQNCAGLNIQFMTDLVFFHKITDENIESQVAGRGQRIGRTCNLRIHYLCYQNEKALI